MSRHFLENLLGNAESLEVAGVHDEEDTVDIWIEEAPAFTVSALCDDKNEQFEVETYLTRHVVNEALGLREWQSDLVNVDERRGGDELSLVGPDILLVSLEQGRLARVIKTNKEKFPCLTLVITVATHLRPRLIQI